MKIILLTDIKNLGKKDEILNVSDGYAYNYLIPKKLAVPFNNHSQNYLLENNKKKQIERNKELKKALYYQKKLQETTLYFAAKCSPIGDMIGIISHKQIEEELKRNNILINKKNFLNKNQINQFGLTELKIVLFENIIGTIKIFVKKM